MSQYEKEILFLHKIPEYVKNLKVEKLNQYSCNKEGKYK